MKIILLRHEERGINIGFNSELTDNGILKSLELPKKLENIKIDIIYCSPFIRTLQTIYPYSIQYEKKINVEYGLYEYLHNPYFLLIKWYYSQNDITDKDLKKIINKKYKSICNKNDFILLEDELNLERRINKFFDHLKKYHSNKSILLVTHKGVINKIKDMFVKKTDMDDEFEMGSFEIYKI